MLLSIPTAGADIAYLKNGRTIDISGFRMEGERVVLRIEGGGEMTLPASLVASIERRGPVPATPDVALPATLVGPAPVRPEGEPAPPGTPPIVVPEGALPDRNTIRGLAARIARQHAVDERLVLAVIEVESRFNVLAVSPRGAIGLMQLMPMTAARFDVRRPYDPAENIDGGVRYLKELLERYSGQRRLALAAYNAGEEAVERFGGIPPYRETIRYIERVLAAVPR